MASSGVKGNPSFEPMTASLAEPLGTPPRACPGDRGKRRLTGEARVEVVEGAYLAGRERIVEDRELVEAADGIQAADVVENLVERLLAREHELTVLLGVGRRQHRLTDPCDRPDEARGRVAVEQEPQLVDVGD